MFKDLEFLTSDVILKLDNHDNIENYSRQLQKPQAGWIRREYVNIDKKEM